MADGTTAGVAGATLAPADFILREPTFGDWVACGDINRQFLVASPDQSDGATATIEFALDPAAIAAWFPVLTGQTAASIRGLDIHDGKRLFQQLKQKIPNFGEREYDGGRGPVVLDRPLPGARGETREVTIRRLSVGDWLDCGDITTERIEVDETAARASNTAKRLERRLNRRAVNEWMIALTGLGEPILHLMAYEDARRVFAVVRNSLAGITEGN